MPQQKSVTPWFLYVIETKYQHLYTGITLDWQRRFNEHKSNSAKSAKALKGKGPLTLRFCVQFEDRTSAMQCEIWLKKQNRKTKINIIEKRLTLPFSYAHVDHNELTIAK